MNSTQLDASTISFLHGGIFAQDEDQHYWRGGISSDGKLPKELKGKLPNERQLLAVVKEAIEDKA